MKKVFKNKNLLIFLFFTIPIIPLASQSIGRTVFLITTLTLWYFISLKLDTVLASLLFFTFTLPFNITIQIPQQFLEKQLYDPFVIGVIVNQLIPTLSITDLAVMLILISILAENQLLILKELAKHQIKHNFTKNCYTISKKLVTELNKHTPLLIGFIYFIIHNLIFRDFLVFFQSARFLFWGITLYLFIKFNIHKRLLSTKFRRYLLLTLLFTVVSQLIIGGIQFKQGFSLGLKSLGESNLIKGYAKTSWIELGGKLYLRAYGTFPHPNLLAGYLTLIQLILISAVFKKKYLIIIKYVILALSSILVLLTLSRIGFLLLFINTSLLLSQPLKKYIKNFSHTKKIIKVSCNLKNQVILKNCIIIFTSAILLILPIALFSQKRSIITERILTLFSSGSVSVTDRINLIKVSWKILKNNPLLGVGTNRFIASMGKNAPITAGRRLLFEPVHNIFILILVEHGILIGITFTYSLFKYLIKNRPNINNITFWLASMIWLLITANFDHYLLTLPQGLALLFIFLIYQKMLKFK